jgi:PAS domain-containing protein
MLKNNREYALAGLNRQDEANESVPANALRWLERMLAASPDPAYFFDMKSRRLLAVNRLLVKLLRYRWEELLAKSVEDLRPLEELPHLLRSLKQEPPSNSVDCRHIRKDGTLLFVRAFYRDNYYLDSEGSEHAIRLVTIIQADTSPLIGLEMGVPVVRHIDRYERRDRQDAWLNLVGPRVNGSSGTAAK